MANAGDLDTSFDGNGKKAIDFGGTDVARAVLVQSNGKIVLAGFSGPEGGSIQVARLNPNGALDATFGAAGKATVDFGVATFGNAVALQSNGRIVVAGQRTGGDDFAVARLIG